VLSSLIATPIQPTEQYASVSCSSSLRKSRSYARNFGLQKRETIVSYYPIRKLSRFHMASRRQIPSNGPCPEQPSFGRCVKVLRDRWEVFLLPQSFSTLFESTAKYHLEGVSWECLNANVSLVATDTPWTLPS